MCPIRQTAMFASMPEVVHSVQKLLKMICIHKMHYLIMFPFMGTVVFG